MKSLEVLSNNKETHLKINPNATYEEMRGEMKKLIDRYEATRKAELHHLNPASHSRFESLKSPEYQDWYKEKVRLENETKIAFSNMDTLARHFCPHIYIV